MQAGPRRRARLPVRSPFDLWFDRLVAQASIENTRAVAQLARVEAALRVLQELAGEPTPTLETPTLKKVRQSRDNLVWRVSHPFTPGVAVRLIVWFPPGRPGDVVVVLFGADKASMGDVFYDGVGARADAVINSYRMITDSGNQTDN